ncbi:hypothetical protein F5888DRAFT_1635215 [Russula emetica]|nr:hypothetical protein F5888DRAFT_1635215 [Russula emetica]
MTHPQSSLLSFRLCCIVFLTFSIARAQRIDDKPTTQVRHRSYQAHNRSQKAKSDRIFVIAIWRDGAARVAAPIVRTRDQSEQLGSHGLGMISDFNRPSLHYSPPPTSTSPVQLPSLVCAGGTRPTWSPDSLLGISDGGGAPESVAKGTTNLTLHTRGDWGQPLHDYTAHRDIPIVVVLGLQFGNSS